MFDWRKTHLKLGSCVSLDLVSDLATRILAGFVETLPRKESLRPSVWSSNLILILVLNISLC